LLCRSNQFGFSVNAFLEKGLVFMVSP
jgi:hypothetical protein